MHKEDFVQEDQISNASDDLTDGNFSAYFEDDPMGAGVSIYSVYHRFVRFVRKTWSRRSQIIYVFKNGKYVGTGYTWDGLSRTLGN
ncbi:hypothetical protein CDAR_505301 [Caerostris darwini]|uniref:Uncharacterized protein n=1 Tax=Caerostris darwini TaxID=1538125 RepID=A0AAV4UNX1_9ARAC|nr:hypothetical protein CDAR_505301 [Caerostris darwini]